MATKKRKPKYRTVRVKNIRFSPALYYVPEAMIELWKNKTPEQTIGMGIVGMYEEPAILIMLGDEVAAFLSYYLYSGDNAINTTLAYVRPEHRRNGLHAKLFDELKKIAAEKEIVYIGSGTEIENTISLESQQKQGRVVTGYSIGYFMTKVPWR